MNIKILVFMGTLCGAISQSMCVKHAKNKMALSFLLNKKHELKVIRPVPVYPNQLTTADSIAQTPPPTSTRAYFQKKHNLTIQIPIGRTWAPVSSGTSATSVTRTTPTAGLKPLYENLKWIRRTRKNVC